MDGLNNDRVRLDFFHMDAERRSGRQLLPGLTLTGTAAPRRSRSGSRFRDTGDAAIAGVMHLSLDSLIYYNLSPFRLAGPSSPLK